MLEVEESVGGYLINSWFCAFACIADFSIKVSLLYFNCIF